MEGAWTVKNQALELGDQQHQSFLLTNTLLIKSPIVIFYLDIDIKEVPAVSDYKMKHIFGFLFSPQLMDVINFTNQTKSFETNGIGLFFFKQEDKYFVAYEEAVVNRVFNLKDSSPDGRRTKELSFI